MKIDILLSGVVSGITILIGVITADWLKRLRDRINYTRRITVELTHRLKIFIEYLGSHLMARTDTGIGIERSEEELDLIEKFNFLIRELRDLSEIPRWPQRHARRLRQVAIDFRICLIANFEHCSIYQVVLHEKMQKSYYAWNWRCEVRFAQDTLSKLICIISRKRKRN
jgi:hypothetical protein